MCAASRALGTTDGLFSSRALALKRRPLGEADSIVVYLTPQGRVDCVVRSARKSRRWGALLEPLSLIEGQFSRGKNFHYLREARLLSSFSTLRESYDKLQVVGSWIDLVHFVAQPGQDSQLLFRSLVWALTVLSEGAPLAACHFWFELHLLVSLGIRPQLEVCAGCGALEISGWDGELGGFVCSQCNPTAAPLTELATKVVQVLARCPARCLFELELPERETRQIFAALRGHYLSQVQDVERLFRSHPEVGPTLWSQS